MADKTALTDKTAANSDTANVAAHGTAASLFNASLKDCRAASSAMSSKCDAELNNVSITNGSASNITSGAGTLESSPAQLETTHRTGVMGVAHETMERSQAALKNTEAYMLAADTSAADTSDADKLKSADVLAANGIKELKGGDGTQYNISLDKDNSVQLKTTDLNGKSFDVSAKLSAGGSEILKGSNSELLNASEKIAHPPLPERNTNHPPDATQKPTGKDALFDPSLSQEDKLKAARDMADHGQKRFKEPDGKDYEINTQKFGNTESVTIFQGDGKGHSHAMMRGIVDDHGNVTQQHYGKGAVDIESDYAKKTWW